MSKRIFSLLLAVWCTSPAVAWNSLGHKVVAEIAWQQLSPEQRQSIVDTLRRHPQFDRDFVVIMDDDAAKGDKATQDHWIFQHAATWPDIIRNDKEYDRPEWHYIDLPLFLDINDRGTFAGKLPANIATDYPTKVPREHYNVVQAIAHCRSVFKANPSPGVRAMVYCWLFHLVGDIHQPLHSTALFNAARFPKGDRGGNEIPLKNGGNLHKLWDNLLGRDSRMRDVTKAVAELSDRSKYGDVWSSAGTSMEPLEWANESHFICESVVYSDSILDAARAAGTEKLQPIELPDSYYPAAGRESRKRIIAAGLRLANLLRGLPDQGAGGPTSNPPVNSLAPRGATTGKPPATASTLTHWLTIETGVRHNQSCQWYGKSDGRACTEEEGRPCRKCGG